MYKMCKSNTYFVLLNLTNKIKRGRTVSRISQKLTLSTILILILDEFNSDRIDANYIQR